MFDINYYNLLNAIRVLVDSINDYSKFKDMLLKKEDYINLFNTFMVENNIDYETYMELRGYLILCDVYFRDYETNYLDKKLAYAKRNFWKNANTNTIRVKC